MKKKLNIPTHEKKVKHSNTWKKKLNIPTHKKKQNKQTLKESNLTFKTYIEIITSMWATSITSPPSEPYPLDPHLQSVHNLHNCIHHNYDHLLLHNHIHYNHTVSSTFFISCITSFIWTTTVIWTYNSIWTCNSIWTYNSIWTWNSIWTYNSIWTCNSIWTITSFITISSNNLSTEVVS